MRTKNKRAYVREGRWLIFNGAWRQHWAPSIASDLTHTVNESPLSIAFGSWSRSCEPRRISKTGLAAERVKSEVHDYDLVCLTLSVSLFHEAIFSTVRAIIICYERLLRSHVDI